MRQQAPGRDQGPLKGDQRPQRSSVEADILAAGYCPFPRITWAELIDRVRRWGKENVGSSAQARPPPWLVVLPTTLVGVPGRRYGRKPRSRRPQGPWTRPPDRAQVVRQSPGSGPAGPVLMDNGGSR
jgi:hypothetical protein